MSHFEYVPPRVCPSVSMSPLYEVSFVCMYLMSLLVYVTPCICHSVCMSLHEYFSSRVCPFLCISFCHVFFMCESLYIPCLRMLLHVHVPSCVCPFVCMYVALCMSLHLYVLPCVCPFYTHVSFVYVHVPPCICRSMCMSLRVYNVQGIGSILMYVSLYLLICPNGL